MSLHPAPLRIHATSLQPSEDEIQREVENLRDIRRRSTAQGGPSSIIDPDLPTHSPQSPTHAAYWAADDSSSDSHSHEGPTEPATPTDDPFSLFWVPARMHPEIDPSQFRQFLKEHARAPDGVSSLSRAGSMGSASGLGRKRSMLSRQYDPSEHGSGDEKDVVVSLRRNRSSYYNTPVPQLTIKDLERLDELAEEASQSSDPTKLRSVLRRSLSMNVSPSAIDKLDNVPDPGDDADAPIIVPRPGQILRRSARTKIRKPGQTSEGAHRFNATRRGSVGARAAAAAAAATAEANSVPPVPFSAGSTESSSSQPSSEPSSSDHGEREFRARALSTGSISNNRPESFSVESFIFDAYANDEDDDKGTILVSPILSSEPLDLPFLRSPSPTLDMPPSQTTRLDAETTPVPSPAPSLSSSIISGPSTPNTPALASPTPSPGMVAMEPFTLSLDLHQPVPQRVQGVQEVLIDPYRSRSPDSTTTVGSSAMSMQDYPVPLAQPLRSPPTSQFDRKEKDKKGGLFKWGSDKKNKKEKEREREREKEKEKEKDSSFFGSLFGTKKKQDDSVPGLGHNAGREAAVALLGASKSSRSLAPSPQPGQPGVNNYSRYPIHVERAIYRLSHIKLANPRRPLYEQVLISNLMFWYLGVINKAQTQTQQQQAQAQQLQQSQQSQAQQAQQPQQAAQQVAQQAYASANAMTPQVSVPIDREREERERQEREQAEREQTEQQRRRSGLTKSSAQGAGANGGGRRAEMPVRGPQYDMQHRAMEQEHFVRTATSSAYGGGSYVPQASYGISPPQPARGSTDMLHEFGGNTNGRSPAHREKSPPHQPWPDQQPRQALGPRGQQTVSPPRTDSPPHSAGYGSPRRSRSPPPQNRYVPVAQDVSHSPPGSPSPGRMPARSASATASSVVNAKLGGRKTTSVHAVAPGVHGRPRQTNEDEDVPLAMWQQQQAQRRR